MPNIPPPVIDETSSFNEPSYSSSSVSNVLAQTADGGFPIFDAKESKVYSAPHNPVSERNDVVANYLTSHMTVMQVDILKIFADAYSKHATTIVHSPGNGAGQGEASSRQVSMIPAASQSYPIFTKSS